MASFYTQLLSLWRQLVSVFAGMHVIDVLDILVVAALIYKGVQVMRETRAGQLLKGIALFVLLYLAAWLLNMNALLWLINAVMQYGIIAVLIVFQPELRRVLEQIGRSRIRRFGLGLSPDEATDVWHRCIENICRACVAMQRTRTGVLLVIERATPLGEIAQTGTLIEGDASADLLCNLFFPKSPLHDGAVIVRDGRIYAAGCILPLTANEDLSRELGTRHRAAIGISEESDAVVVVVSEENGVISVARGGLLERDFTSVTLRELLERELVGSRAGNGHNKRTGRKRKGETMR